MDKFWAIWGAVRPFIARFVPWGTAKLIAWFVLGTWLVTSGGCIYIGRGVVQSQYARGYQDGFARCDKTQPAPDDGKRRGPFRWLFTPALEAPDVSIVEHEQYDGEPELMEAPQ